MRTRIGVHPDLPYPFSNGPEEFNEPKYRNEPLRVATQRQEHGVEVFSALINYWFTRSGLSHEQMCAISSWGLHEKGMIDGAVLSRIRNGKQTRGAGLKHVDALAAANRAIWLWQKKGEERARADLGPYSSWSVQETWLNSAVWLSHPDDESLPLEFADFMLVLGGYMDLPYLNVTNLSPANATRLIRALGKLIEDEIKVRSWGPREAVAELLKVYPVDDQVRKERFREVILGTYQYSKTELEGEMYAIGEVIREIRRLRGGEFGVRELREELLSAHHQ